MAEPPSLASITTAGPPSASPPGGVSARREGGPVGEGARHEPRRSRRLPPREGAAGGGPGAVGGEPDQPPHRFLQRHQVLLPDVNAEPAGEGAQEARVE